MSDEPTKPRPGVLLEIQTRVPRLTLVLVAVVTLALGVAARSLTVDSSPAQLLPVGDPSRDLAEAVEREFGGAETIVIGVFADDVFAPSTVAKIDRLSTRLWHLDAVSSVISPTTLLRPEVEDGRLRMVPLVRELPQSAAAASALRSAVLAHPLARKSVVAADAGAAGILVRLHPGRSADFGRARLAAEIRDLVAQFEGPERFAVTGLPSLTAQANEDMWRDFTTLTPVALVLVFAVLLLTFRSAQGVLIPLAVVSIGLVWTLAAMALTGHGITFGTLALPPLLALVGVALPLHIVARYECEALPERPAAEALEETVAGVRLPVAVVTLTSVLGVSALAFSAIPALRDFSLYGALGVASMFVASVLVVPAALMVWPATHLRPRVGSSTAMAARLERIGDCTVRHRKSLLLLAVAVTGVCVAGIGRIRVETGYLTFSNPASAVRMDYSEVSRRLASPRTVGIVIDSGETGSIDRLEILLALRDLQNFVGRQPGVDSTLSVLDYLALATGAGEPGDPSPREDLDTLVWPEPAYLAEVVNPERSRTLLLVYTSLAGGAAMTELLERIEAFASPKLLYRRLGERALFPRGVVVYPIGVAAMLNQTAAVLVRDYKAALLWVPVALLVVTSLLFLSPRIGLFAVLLNVSSVIAVLGLMGWAGASLNVITGPVAFVVLGVAVGHTTHFLSACGAAGGSPDCAPDVLAPVLGSTGRQIGAAALALGVGFLVFAVSSLNALRWFGYLGSAAVAVSFIVSMAVLATRVLATRIITVGDLMLMRLRRVDEIPLFADLRPFQAKIVVLTGRLAKAARGEFITRRGELKPELYLLLSGAAEVRASAGGQPINNLTHGDVIGEMGLVRQRPRSADVIATEDTEYLVLDSSFLDRLRRQYPRIAATLFLNLTRILSDRLDHTTEQLAGIAHERPGG